MEFSPAGGYNEVGKPKKGGTPVRKQARLVRGVAALLLLAAALSLLSACSLSDLASGGQSGADAVLGSGTRVLRILSGSENAELEPILEEYAREQDGAPETE